MHIRLPPFAIRKSLPIVVACAALLPQVGTRADTTSPVDDPLAAARWADRAGDANVLQRLAPTHPPVMRLRAIRATPAMSDPEHALAPLAALAGGRDPDLAPAAARAALAIAQTLSHDSWQQREVPVELREIAIKAFQAVLDQPGLRQDIALMAVQVVTYLEALTAQ